MSACLNTRHEVQFLSNVVKATLWSEIAQKSTIQPMMKFSQLICCGLLHWETKFKKTVRQNLIYFWNRRNFTVFSLPKMCQTDFYFTLHKYLIRANFLFSKFWGVVMWVDFEKNIIKPTSAQSLLRCMVASFGHLLTLTMFKFHLQW